MNNIDTIQILIFDDNKRLSFVLNEKSNTIKDVTLKNGDEDLLQIMSILSHKKIDEAIKCLNCDNIENEYSNRIVEILKVYNY